MRRLLPLLLVAACSSTSSQSASPTGTSPPAPTASPEGVEVVVGDRPCGVLAAAGSVWVSAYGNNQVARLDPRSHRVLSRAATGAAPCGMAYGAASIWVENYTGSSVTRVDAASGKRLRDYTVGL